MGGDSTSSGATVAEIAAAGRRRWPSIDVPSAVLARFLEERTPGEDGVRAPAEDLYLACACLAGNREAHGELERTVLCDVPKAIRRVDGDPDFVDEVAADLRLAILDDSHGVSALSRYRGAGPLRSFVMVLAMRRAVDRKRRQKEIATEASGFSSIGVEDPGIAGVGAATFREAFAQALRERLAALAPRDRNILRLHFMDGLAVEAIARMYGVHRATVARWIVHAKETIFEETRGALEERFQLSKSSFDSLARDTVSAMDVTLTSVLRSSR